MNYLVLARKWRPQSFDTVVGQDHVVRALAHALDNQRLHHAWLFTGTRGVGKTTLSRILAKALNCENGITSKSCNQCGACTEIDAGCFVDYIELDAASNRGVEDMTHLLEQASYAPGVGRFKVYMIDEVHMLTGHAFNAMLKTLEEPPPHVKFILATTDPQKIPVTVLSRCLQFNLKQMPVAAIVGHLQHVLRHERQQFEVSALRLLAQAALGSMRDALSLTDQAIAYCAGHLTENGVRDMLGTIDQRYLVHMLDALALGDAHAVHRLAEELATRGLSYRGALADLAVLLSRIAIEQHVAGSTTDETGVATDIVRLAQSVHPDTVQLFYSIAVHSRHELSLAPDEYGGFLMTCLRMLALNAETVSPVQSTRPVQSVVSVPSMLPASPAEPVQLEHMSTALWPQWIASLPVTGLAAELARQSEWIGVQNGTVTLRVAVKTLADTHSRTRLQKALSEHFGQNIRLVIEVGETSGATACAMAQQVHRVRQQVAEAAVTGDPFVQSLVENFDAHVVPGSICPVESSHPSSGNVSPS